MYDTSDIRKGLKVLMDGNPFTVIEFQFVKPGKGAAFTRTKFKNLLTGAVVERNIRSGEKLEPANVEERSMQFLYKEGEDLVFMDESNYEQVSARADLVVVALAHEDEILALLVEELHGALLDVGGLQLLARA